MSHWVPKKAAVLCLLSLRGVIKNGKNLLFCTIGGGGLKFLLKFTKTIFALELSTNVMKHTIHEWGGDIFYFHNLTGPPQKIPTDWGGSTLIL